MKEYYADFDAPNPVHTIRNDDAIAITANNNEVTYAEFNILIKEMAGKLEAAGLREQHRVLVVGDHSDIIATSVLMWGAMYLGASPANASSNQSKMEIELKQRSAEADAILWVDGTIEIMSDLTKTTKQHPEERFLYYTSGTTKKETNLYTTELGFFNYPNDAERGFGQEDDIMMVSKVLGEYTQIRLVSNTPWEIAYTPHNLVKCLLTGGSFHWVATEAEVPAAHKKYDSNVMSTFPVQFHRLCEFEYDHPIPFVEVCGGEVTNELIAKMQKNMKVQTISNSFASSGSGLLFVNLITGPSTDCSWFEQLPEINVRVKLDERGQLWTSRGVEWFTDGDLFEEKDGKYKYASRGNDEFISAGGGKISVWEIEGYARSAVTDDNTADQLYVFPMDGFRGYPRHGLIYSGTLDIDVLASTMNLITGYKQPQMLFQVDEEFWHLYTKISRSHMADRIRDNSGYVLRELERKDYNKT